MDLSQVKHTLSLFQTLGKTGISIFLPRINKRYRLLKKIHADNFDYRKVVLKTFDLYYKWIFNSLTHTIPIYRLSIEQKMAKFLSVINKQNFRLS